jgi:hypothetical protein
MKKLVIVIFALFLLVLLAGVYKFNFTDSDIFVKNSKGEWVNWEKPDDWNSEDEKQN